MGVQIDAVLSLEVPDETIVTRMSGRRTCPGCGASYHVLYKPSAKADVCDKCGADLVIRADDKPETVLNRLKTFHDQTEPVKSYYAAKNKLICVVGQEEVADTTKLVFEALSKI
jgi:adenylate kinase